MTAPALQLWPTMRRVERFAWNAIVRCVKLKKLSSLPLPIPVEQWIEGPLGIQFSIGDLSHLGSNVLGLARAKDREIMVSDPSWTRARCIVDRMEPRWPIHCNSLVGQHRSGLER